MTPLTHFPPALTLPMTEAKSRVGSQAPVIYFDGVCGLCNHFVQFLLEQDSEGRFLFAPLQGSTARERLDLPDITRIDSVVFTADGRTWKRSAAVVRILRTLGGKWRWAGNALWLVPAPVRDLVYSAVANLRYRVFGKSEACRLPTPEERDRFLP